MTEVLKTPVGKTKNDLWKAYKELRDQLAQSEAGQLATTTDVARKKAVEKATKAASDLDVTNLSQGVTALMASIDQAKAVYEELQTAIEAKKEELKEVHGIEVEANTYIALAEAKNRLVEEKEADAAKIIAEAQENAASIKQWIVETRNDEHRRHKRDEEEWEYDFERTKKQRQDQFRDELNEEIRKMDARIAEVEAREAKMDEIEREKEILQQELDREIANSEQKIEAAVVAAKEQAQRNANIAKAMDSKTHEAEIKVKNAEVENLRERLQETQEQLMAQRVLVQEAQAKVADMAQASLKAGADAATVARISEIAAGSSKK